MATEVYDYIVVGSGLTGLLIAQALSEKTQKVALLEGLDQAGGVNKAINFPGVQINNGLRFVPQTEKASELIAFLETRLGHAVNSGAAESAPLTFEGGNIKSFVGFGANPPGFYDDISYFLTNERMNLSAEPHQWVQTLLQNFKGTFLPKSYVTRFVRAEGGTDKSQTISHVLVNGSKTLHAHQFIFAGCSKDLPLLCDDEVLPVRAKTKLGKVPYWNGLCLDLVHAHKVTDFTNQFLLNGTTQDDLGPSTGHFLPSYEIDGQTRQVSQWMTFIESDQHEDESENIGLALKKIKRQIKRAYPEALDSLVLERIFVASNISGQAEVRLVDGQRLHSVENLWLGSPQFSTQRNLLGSLDIARKVLISLGFEKADEAQTTASISEDSSDAAAEL